MRSKIVLILLVLVLNNFLSGKIITTLDEVMKPTSIEIDNKNLYVIEGTTVNIYSLKDFKLIKKFGKKGEGPKEFKMMISKLVSQTDNLLINSFGKISLYTKEGIFIKEIKTGTANIGGFFYQLKEGYVGTSVIVENNIRYMTVNIFDSKFKKVKMLEKYTLMKNGKIDVISATRIAGLSVHNDFIYLPAGDGLKINIFNSSGEKKGQIQHPYKKVKFTAQDEKYIRRIMKKNMPKGQYEVVKNMFVFPEYYPEVFKTKVSNNILYIMTWEKRDGKFKFLLYDLKTKKIKTTFLKLEMKNGFETYPEVIIDNKMYQLIENDDSEEWELHVSKII